MTGGVTCSNVARNDDSKQEGVRPQRRQQQHTPPVASASSTRESSQHDSRYVTLRYVTVTVTITPTFVTHTRCQDTIKYYCIQSHRWLESNLRHRNPQDRPYFQSHFRLSAADLMRTSWEKLVHYVGTNYGQNISNELHNKISVDIIEPVHSAEVLRKHGLRKAMIRSG
jgi:hypothetical protein